MKFLKWTLAISGIIVLGIIGFYFFSGELSFNIQNVVDSIESFGIFAPIIFILIMASAIVISPIPSGPLDITAGIIWGPWLGTLYSAIGATLGAVLAFAIARAVGQQIVERLLKKKVRFCKYCTDHYLVWVIFISRLFPFFQFDIISYGSGFTTISIKKFALATFLGTLPVTFLFVFFGKSLIVPGSLPIVLFVVLFGLMIFIPLYMHREALMKKFEKKFNK